MKRGTIERTFSSSVGATGSMVVGDINIQEIFSGNQKGSVIIKHSELPGEFGSS